MTQFLISFLLAFLCGSLPTAYLAGRFFKGVDIRSLGSGNVGATNAFRVFGKKIGSLVFLIDFLKGALPTFFFLTLIRGSSALPSANLWIGFGAILGHVFTPFLGFKGGKGVATGGGVLCAAYPILFLITVVVWTVTFLLSRIVSVSSILALLALIVSALLFGVDQKALIFFVLVSIFIIWTHRTNLIRLVKGKENRF